MIPTLEWLQEKQALKMVDQTLLPNKLEFLELTTLEEVANSIKNMHVRGAPAIGVTAAFGMVIAGLQNQALKKDDFFEKMYKSAKILKQTRPTAVNLFWAIDLMLKELEDNRALLIKEIAENLLKKALQMWEDDYQINLKMGEHGASILNDGDTVLTHCNAGSLATVKYGTALAPIRWAIENQGKKIAVIADETRPRLQGARLTAWELHYDNIPVQVETDSMAGLMMRLGKIQKIIVGADRVVSDTVINKIGTYMVAMAAKYHNIPMYVVAPTSTLSLTETEKDVVIEQRDGDFEVGRIMGRVDPPIVPKGVQCINYAFDATPMELITGIITEDGIFTPKELLERYLNS